MCDVFGNALRGENKWRYRSSKRKPDMYQVDPDAKVLQLRRKNAQARL
jgi:hypothetical protein